ncbi:MAG: hypothetical protein EOR57_05765 [Mesorhizobium sp.]|uniref:hypothetical protein n=1 Tax=Mesorhizobium sp. TaxID=1871066 RepID=UPI000FD2BB31|nr:hypothetical protein [Mesorhizobium sp.]RUV98276.1 hypothetical protein EOA88_00100 [Mesorhizobium sp. M5C.F.Ca.IN.020.14.1.1]RWL21942.1 MAG: hypothetical protein EOR57_05765 [Mesorhizobium sp.]TJW57504.1 MAG: hypothetical protein E5X59_00880 [Mesorhizobium sp.]
MANSLDFIAVADKQLVYIGMTNREAFDRIDLPVLDHGDNNEKGHVLSKKVGNFGSDEVTVVFQYWLKSPTSDGGR